MNKNPINVLSLFDGMSCGHLALDRAGVPVENYFSSEIDRWAIKVTLDNYPSTIQLGDVKNWMGWELPNIDLLIGGSPCQGFSFAGKGLNFDDPRSKLFFEFVNILKEFKKKNPNILFLLENVTMKKEWEEIISSYLGVEPILINSSLVSAQNRRRLYWTNIPNVIQPEDKNIVWGDVQEVGAKDVFWYTDDSLKWINKEEKRRKKFKIYGVDSDDKMQMLEASHYKGYSNQRCFGVMDGGRLRYISPIECERLQNVPDGYTETVSRTQRYKMLGNGWTVDVLAHIFRNIK